MANRWFRALSARDPEQAHRASTPLELFFDLCFVVAIASAAAELHHDLAAGHVAHALRAYALVFFCIWWAWVNFTWFASAYDNDDAPYRIGVFAQMLGVLVIAAGISRAFKHGDFSTVTWGYVILRLALVTLWLRAARNDPLRRRTALRYAVGVGLCQFAWVALLFVPPEKWLWGWFVLAPIELLVPAWAESAAPTTWHRHHIAERYGLLTIIVLGESVLASTLAIQTALDAGGLSVPMLRMVVGGLLVLFGMWWIYFDAPAHEVIRAVRAAFWWGYGHYIVFGSAAAVGAGLAVWTEYLGDKDHVPANVAAFAVPIPLALYLLTVWAMHARPMNSGRVVTASYWIAVVCVLAAAMSPWPVLLSGVVVAALVTMLVVAD